MSGPEVLRLGDADAATVRAALAALPGDAVVAVIPADAVVVDPDGIAAAIDVAQAVVIAAAVDAAPGTVPPEVEASTPYVHPCGRAVAGRAVALVSLLDDAAADRPAASVWSEAFLAGADMVLDSAAEVFLVPDGTGTDLVDTTLGFRAAATGSAPCAVVDATPVAAVGDPTLLFSYAEGMAEPQDLPEVVADELLSLPLWTPGMCRAVIAAAETAGLWGSDPDDPVPGHETSLQVLCPPLLAGLEAHLEAFVVPAWRHHWPEFAWCGIHDAFVIKYTAGGSGGLALHHDVAQISASVRLNSGYQGGELLFPRQQFSNSALPVGTVLAWPSLVTHPHRSTPVTRGVKYGLTIWLRLPD